MYLYNNMQQVILKCRLLAHATLSGDSLRQINGDWQRFGTSLMVQWLGLCTSTLRGTGSNLVGELGSCIPWSVTKKKKFVLYDVIDKKLKNRKNWDLPGDTVAKIPCYSIPGQGTISHLTQLKIPHAITKTQHRQINRFLKKSRKS